ncbi:hypothetical protein G5V59_24325 [Nocardioides sp. W3-2-3]|nr:hypothetical protein [Nocardioides convexus]
MWYLLALVVWRLLTPVFRPLPGAFLVAVGIAVGSGFLTGEWMAWMDLPRILGFLPFFVLGLKTSPEGLEWLRGRFPALLGVVTFGVIAVLAVNIDRWADTSYLYQRPYEPDGRHGLDRHRDPAAGPRGRPRRHLRLARRHPARRWLVRRDGRRHDDRLPVPRLRREGPAVRRLPGVGRRSPRARPARRDGLRARRGSGPGGASGAAAAEPRGRPLRHRRAPGPGRGGPGGRRTRGRGGGARRLSPSLAAR